MFISNKNFRKVGQSLEDKMDNVIEIMHTSPSTFDGYVILYKFNQLEEVGKKEALKSYYSFIDAFVEMCNHPEQRVKNRINNEDVKENIFNYLFKLSEEDFEKVKKEIEENKEAKKVMEASKIILNIERMKIEIKKKKELYLKQMEKNEYLRGIYIDKFNHSSSFDLNRVLKGQLIIEALKYEEKNIMNVLKTEKAYEMILYVLDYFSAIYKSKDLEEMKKTMPNVVKLVKLLNLLNKPEAKLLINGLANRGFNHVIKDRGIIYNGSYYLRELLVLSDKRKVKRKLGSFSYAVLEEMSELIGVPLIKQSI